MRVELLEKIAGQIDRFHLRQEYDYAYARQRLIFEALTQGVHYVYNNAVEGDIAEFGTALGNSTYTIAKAMGIYQDVFGKHLAQYGVGPRTLYLLDSFEGLPQAEHPADTASPNVQVGRWGAGVYQGLTPEELRELCTAVYFKDRVRIIRGWFAQTLRQIPPGTRFAMVHLDCDLYSSTFEVLDHLFGQRLVSDGCMLFFDDWNCNRSSPRFGQRRAWREAVEKYRLEYSDCGDYAVLSHKFIVHVES